MKCKIVKNPLSHDLPDGYTEVKYIQSNGTDNAYIDLPIHFNPRDEIETKFANEDAESYDKYMICSSLWNSPSGTRFSMGHFGNIFTCGFGSLVTNNTYLSPLTTEDNRPYTWIYKDLEYKIEELDISYQGSASSWASGDLTVSTNGYVRLMWGYNDGTKGKMYYYKHNCYNGTKFDLVPAKRNSDNAYGMYDLVSKQFFGNSGSGAFTGGPIIEKFILQPVATCKVVKSNNLFDKDAVLLNYYINSAGTLVPVPATTNSWCVSDYIEVKENTSYYYRIETIGVSPRICFYDANKEFISSRQQATLFTTVSNTKYVRLNILKPELDTVQLSKGNAEIPYEPYGLKLQPVENKRVVNDELI